MYRRYTKNSKINTQLFILNIYEIVVTTLSCELLLHFNTIANAAFIITFKLAGFVEVLKAFTAAV